MKQILNFRLLALLFASILVTSCDDDTPPSDNLPEVFTNVTLIFTPVGGGNAITAGAEDPDGEGPIDLIVEDEINLAAGTTYTLTFNVENRLDPDADLNQEIFDEDNEHQIFFAFTNNAFTTPSGNGNMGASNAADPINYSDTDENGNPVGLVSSWTTGAAVSGASFTANLQHQPGVKTSTSTSEDGDTDFLLEFVLNIQ